MTREKFLEKIKFEEGDRAFVISLYKKSGVDGIYQQRINHGIGTAELLGLLELMRKDVHQQVEGAVEAEIVETERKVLVDKSEMDNMSDDERLEFMENTFKDYCKHCGKKDAGCQCWNDE